MQYWKLKSTIFCKGNFESLKNFVNLSENILKVPSQHNCAAIFSCKNVYPLFTLNRFSICCFLREIFIFYLALIWNSNDDCMFQHSCKILIIMKVKINFYQEKLCLCINCFRKVSNFVNVTKASMKLSICNQCNNCLCNIEWFLIKNCDKNKNGYH